MAIETTLQMQFRHAEKQMLARFGLDARERFLELKAPKMRARVLEVGDGEPVVFVVGGMGSPGGMYAPLLPHLKGVRAYLVDRPCSGLTDGFDYRGTNVPRHAADFILSVMDELGLDRATLVGNSMGGLWVLHTCLAAPKRINAAAFTGSPSFVLDAPMPLAMRLMAFPALGRWMRGMMPVGTKGAAMMLTQMGETGAAKRLPSEMMEYLGAILAMPDAELGWQTMLPEVITWRGGKASMRLNGQQLGQVSQPCSFVWGTRDVFGDPELGRRVVAALPHAELTVVEAGHIPWLSEPEACARAVQRALELGTELSRQVTVA